MINKDREVGGTHYSDMNVEPIELIEAFDLNFVQGSIVKYVSRYKSKGGVQDLEKALHYCEIGLDDKSNGMDLTKKDNIVIDWYCISNNIHPYERYAIESAITKDYGNCKSWIYKVIEG